MPCQAAYIVVFFHVEAHEQHENMLDCDNDMDIDDGNSLEDEDHMLEDIVRTSHKSEFKINNLVPYPKSPNLITRFYPCSDFLCQENIVQ